MDVRVNMGTTRWCHRSGRCQQTGKLTDSPAGTAVGWNLSLHALSVLSVIFVEIVCTVMLSGGCQTHLLSSQAGIWACR